MNKKTMVSLLLCLVLGVSLFALPAFADSTVIVIGGPVGQTQSSSIVAQSPVNSVSSINSSGAVIVAGTGNAPVQTPSVADSASLGSVIVMPNGSVQKIYRHRRSHRPGAVYRGREFRFPQPRRRRPHQQLLSSSWSRVAPLILRQRRRPSTVWQPSF